MTTIVYRDGVLAADRRVSKCDVTIGGALKIHEVRSPGAGLLGWVACQGWAADGPTVAKWLQAWPDMGEAPKRVAACDVGGLFMLKSGEVFHIGGDAPFTHAAEFHAVGSGWEIATGAMAMGATAVEAVEVAARFDQGTGGGVDSVNADLSGEAG